MRSERAPVTSVTSVAAFPLNRSTRARVETDNAKGRHTRHTLSLLHGLPGCGQTIAMDRAWTRLTGSRKRFVQALESRGFRSRTRRKRRLVFMRYD
jgi:hypothetical protein